MEEAIPAEMMAIAQQRHQARLEQRWQDADQLRDTITSASYIVEDTPQGPKLHRNSHS